MGFSISFVREYWFIAIITIATVAMTIATVAIAVIIPAFVIGPHLVVVVDLDVAFRVNGKVEAAVSGEVFDFDTAYIMRSRDI